MPMDAVFYLSYKGALDQLYVAIRFAFVFQISEEDECSQC